MPWVRVVLSFVHAVPWYSYLFLLIRPRLIQGLVALCLGRKDDYPAILRAFVEARVRNSPDRARMSCEAED